jgi:hypothetical protein
MSKSVIIFYISIKIIQQLILKHSIVLVLIVEKVHAEVRGKVYRSEVRSTG